VAKVIPKKSRTKVTLVLISVVASLSVYSYFAYSRDLFPFTKEFKAKLNKILKGKKEKEELPDDLAAILGEEPGLVDEFGSVNEPRGGTGARGLEEAGGLGDPAIKGDLNMANLYQQELYRQLFLPFEDNPQEGDAIPEDTIVRGGDIPASNTPGVPEPYKYPFPVDERLNDMYGLYPPGGSYGGRDPYSPFYGGGGGGYQGGGGRAPFNPNILRCQNCPPGQTWDSCMCRCADEDEPRLMCFRAECACPEDDYGGNGHDGGDYEEEEDLPPPPDIPVPPDMPGDWLVEVDQLRAVRDRLLHEIEQLREQLQEQIDQLQDRIAQERERRQELEDVVEQIQEEMDDTPPEEHHEHSGEWRDRLQSAEEIRDRVIEQIREITERVQDLHSRATASVAEVGDIDSRIRTFGTSLGSYRTGGGSTTTRTSTAGGGGTYASSGRGGTTACAGGHCVKANSAAKVGSFNRKERQYAFSLMQNKARRMRTIKVKPTSFLKNKQLLNILPPVVAKRHMASRLTIV
jgi:hypothetical protein